jgi:chromosome segregation ATPase
MKDEECVQEKYHLVVNLVSQLREMQERLNELEKMKVEYEIEMSQRILIEENFHKIRTSLEEQLAERGAEMDRITSELQREVGERQRIEQEFHKIRTSLEEQLAERGAEMDRITAERQREVQEWKQILDNLRDRLTNSKF